MPSFYRHTAMSHRITVLPSNEHFTAASNENLLAAAKRQGLPLPHACQSGSCGSCKARLLSGQVASLGNEDLPGLSAADKALGDILLCCSVAQSDVCVSMPHYAGADAAPAQILPARIQQITIEGGNAVVQLALPRQKPFVFQPGQYVDILLPQAQRRSYSIANSPGDTGLLELHVRQHENGIFSAPLFNGSMGEKSIVRLQGPLGSFGLNPSAKPIIMLATGTGFAPIKSLLLQLLAERSTRPLHLFWGVREQHDFYQLAAAKALLAQLPHARLSLLLSRPAADWPGAYGHVQNSAAAAYPDLSGHEVYACGNPAMVTAARHLFTQQHRLPENAFFADSFSPAGH